MTDFTEYLEEEYRDTLEELPETSMNYKHTQRQVYHELTEDARVRFNELTDISISLTRGDVDEAFKKIRDALE